MTYTYKVIPKPDSNLGKQSEGYFLIHLNADPFAHGDVSKSGKDSFLVWDPWWNRLLRLFFLNRFYKEMRQI